MRYDRRAGRQPTPITDGSSTTFALRIVSSLLALTAVACSALEPPTPRSQLLGESYRDVQREYLKPITPTILAAATLHGVTRLDPDISLEVQESRVVLRKRGQDLRTFDVPPRATPQQWGDIVDQVAKAAAAASPAIGGLTEDAVDTALMDGMLMALDRASHYFPPRPASPVAMTGTSSTSHSSAESPPATRGPAGAINPTKAGVEIRHEQGVAVIRIPRFTRNTAEVLRGELELASQRGETLRAAILDLRNNPGGNIEASLGVARLFIADGLVATFVGAERKRPEIVRAAGNAENGGAMPLVMLINGNTASAAELLAVALQENGRAIAVGSPSFGKGTIQTILPLSNGGELWVTSAWIKTPSGYRLDGHGVIPDICTTPEAGGAAGEAFAAAAEPSRRYRQLRTAPRSSLSEAQWTELRSLCPPSPSSSGSDQDLLIAGRIVRALTVVRH